MAIIVGFFLLVVIAALVFYKFYNSQDDSVVDNKSANNLKQEKTEIDNSVVPKGLPKNLPSEPGTKVLQNYETKTQDGRTQSTHIVTSNEKPRAALEIYLKFFKSLGYEGGFDSKISIDNGAQHGRLFKDKETIMLVASPYTDKETRQDTTKVEITLSQTTQ